MTMSKLASILLLSQAWVLVSAASCPSLPTGPSDSAANAFAAISFDYLIIGTRL